MSKRIVEAGYVDYDPRLGLYVIGGEKYENAVEKYSQSNIKPKEGGDSEPNKEGAPGSDP